MKPLNTIILILLLSPIFTYSKIDVEKVKSDFEVMQNSGNAGREFWLTFTPIDTRNGGAKYKNLYIFSSVKTKIDINVKGKSYSRSYDIQPNVPNLIQIESETIEPTKLDIFDKQNSQVYKDMAVHIESEFPIVIYVFL